MVSPLRTFPLMQLGSLSFSFLMPPMIFIVSSLVGLIVSWRWRRTGFAVAAISILLIYACSTPLISSSLLALTAAQPMLRASTEEPQAIVLVTADARWANSPAERDEPGPLTLERIVETARLYRSLGLPILVSGGVDLRSGRSLAVMASAVLEQDFHVPVRWREERSTNTLENAAFSAPILTHNGISAALVVAQDWDMPRLLWSFDRAGIAAIPAGAGVPSLGIDRVELEDFLPGYRGFQDSFLALHELLGLQYYRWRYGAKAPP
jgi:uncharacterized SAM-binding protein YcdF (DUF218 family)